MYFVVNLMTKRVKLFVSNRYLNTFQSFAVNKQIVCKTCNQFKHKLKTNESFSHHLIAFRSASKSSSTDNQLKTKTTNDGSDEGSADETSKPLKKSIETKFKVYSDDDSEVVYDVSEELMTNNRLTPAVDVLSDEWRQSDEELYLYQQKQQKLRPIDETLKRGLNGVFDIQELVQLLRSEKLKDIAVIEVPKEMNYCQHLVLTTASSKRQLNAFIEYFNKVYKHKKDIKDPFLTFGGKASDDWKVVDMKNIVFHVFLRDVREYYDIETLWTVGHEFDDKLQKADTDPVVDIMEKHMKFLQEMKPMN